MPRLTSIPDPLVKSLVSAMDQGGIAMVPGFLHESELHDLQQFVAARVEEFGEKAGLSGVQAINPTILGEISKAPVFLELLSKIYEVGSGLPRPPQALYQIMRCLKGDFGQKNSLIFHYDSYLVTALLPIVIPGGEAPGHLIMMPNFRKVRASYFHNLLDKMILDNPLSQSFLARRYRAKRMTEVAMQPGHLYLFWGYRTIHANAPCDPQNTRATALYHFGDPYADNGVRLMIRRAKNLVSNSQRTY